MTEQRPSKDRVSEAAEIANSFIKYAYDQGMHEVGIDPVKVLTDEIERLRKPPYEPTPRTDAVVRRWHLMEADVVPADFARGLERENDSLTLDLADLETRVIALAMQPLKVTCESCLRLRAALTGISTCSTCEACRGAATLALGSDVLATVPSFADEAAGLIEFMESDFGQSGADVRVEAIRCELQAAYQRGSRSVQSPGDSQ